MKVLLRKLLLVVVVMAASTVVQAQALLTTHVETGDVRGVLDDGLAVYTDGCGKSFACRNICPARIDIERLMARSNAAFLWSHFFREL